MKIEFTVECTNLIWHCYCCGWNADDDDDDERESFWNGRDTMSTKEHNGGHGIFFLVPMVTSIHDDHREYYREKFMPQSWLLLFVPVKSFLVEKEQEWIYLKLFRQIGPGKTKTEMTKSSEDKTSSLYLNINDDWSMENNTCKKSKCSQLLFVHCASHSQALFLFPSLHLHRV